MKAVSPVFGKEMVTLARKRGQFAARAAVLGILLLATTVSWLSVRSQARYSGFADTAYIGKQLCATFAVSLLIAVALVAPALTAPVIAGEKQRDTLGLLLLSNLNARNILVDKLLSRLALVALLVLSGTPLFLTLLAFGGVAPKDVAAVLLAVLGTLLFSSGIGLLFSTLMNRLHTALLGAYIALLAYVMGVFLAAQLHAWPHRLEELLLPVSILDGAVDRAAGFLALSIGVFGASLCVCVRLLPRAAERGRGHPVKRLFRRLNAFFTRINFTRVVILDESRAPMKNPLLWKESHKHFFRSTTFIARCSAWLLALAMLGAVLTLADFDRPVGSDPVADSALVVGALVLGLVVLTASATTLAAEKEEKSFQLLLASPLTARAIVLGKFAGVMKLTVPLLAWCLPWLILIWAAGGPDTWLYRGEAAWLFGARLALAFIAFVPMIATIGLYAGVQRRRSAGALLQAFAVFLGWSLIPAAFVIADSFGRWRWFRGSEDWVLSMSPVTALIMLMDGQFESLWCATLIPLWIVLLRVLIRRFDAMTGRQ